MARLLGAGVIVLLMLLGWRTMSSPFFRNSLPFLQQINAVNQPNVTPNTQTVGVSAVVPDSSGNSSSNTSQVSQNPAGQANFNTPNQPGQSQQSSNTSQGQLW